MSLLFKLKLAALSLSLGLVCSAQTLDECVGMAYSNYPQIKEYGLIEMSRSYDIRNASLAWLPQLSISGKASWQSTVVEMPFDIPGFEFNIPHDQYGLVADVSQQIWDGGASSVKIQLARAGADVKSRQLDVNLYSIRSQVQNTYLGAVLIDKQLELNDVLHSRLERSLGEVRAMLEAGVACESDVDQVQVSILSCEQQKSALMTDRKAYLRMLSLLTGSDLSDARLSEPSVDVIELTDAPVYRPELALYDAQSRQIDVQRQQLNTSISPKLNLSLQGGYGRPGLNMLLGEFDPYFVAGLKLQWNIASLYTLGNDKKKLALESQRVQMARESFLRNNSIDAVQKMSAIEKAADVLARDEQIISLRERIAVTAEQQYKQGVVKMNDYLSHLDEEFNARLDRNVHQIQYTMAVYDYRNTVGYENK